MANNLFNVQTSNPTIGEETENVIIFTHFDLTVFENNYGKKSAKMPSDIWLKNTKKCSFLNHISNFDFLFNA